MSDADEPLLADLRLLLIVEELLHTPISSTLFEAGNPGRMMFELLVGSDTAVIPDADDYHAITILRHQTKPRSHLGHSLWQATNKAVTVLQRAWFSPHSDML